MKKENRNMYKLDFASHLLFILQKLETIDSKLSNFIT
jgi:hypothetical protein